MSEIVLYHHVQGLTDGIEEFADSLRSAGHHVRTPDLYDGLTFDSLEAGAGHAETLGIEALLDRGVSMAGRGPTEVVYAGFSLGALIAHKLAQTRPGCRGALLYHHGDVPLTTFGDIWPKGVDTQIHVAEGDEFLEREVVEEFVTTASASANAELYMYPVSQHLFADSSLASFDPDSARLLTERTLVFLDGR